jgi:hypothetical protein
MSGFHAAFKFWGLSGCSTCEAFKVVWKAVKIPMVKFNEKYTTLCFYVFSLMFLVCTA